jgi:hypothetical protein
MKLEIIKTGTYYQRQKAANAADADLYFELHANSVDSPEPDYGMCVVARRHSKKSMDIAQFMARGFGEAFDVGHSTDIYGSNGVRIGGAGDYNLRFTNMPAVLFEPGFASNPEQARLMESPEGMNAYAELFFDMIQRFRPNAQLVHLSIGHLGSKPGRNDMGAEWKGDRFGLEADYCLVVAEHLVGWQEQESLPEVLLGETDEQLWRLKPDVVPTCLRAGPSWQSLPLDTVSYKSKLHPLGRQGSWSFVQTSAPMSCPTTGWIETSRIQPV